jgi:hypothetical protein
MACRDSIVCAGSRAYRDRLRIRFNRAQGEGLRGWPFLDRKAALTRLRRDTEAGLIFSDAACGELVGDVADVRPDAR